MKRLLTLMTVVALLSVFGGEALARGGSTKTRTIVLDDGTQCFEITGKDYYTLWCE